MDRNTAEVVLAQLPDAFTHFNEVRPHSSLNYKSPRMFRRELARRDQENGANSVGLRPLNSQVSAVNRKEWNKDKNVK